MLVSAIVYLARGKSFLDELLKMHEDKNFMFLLGWILFFLGLITVLLHNVWTLDSRIIVTIAGWSSILQGLARVAFPKASLMFIASAFKDKIMYFRVSMVIVGLIGAWLIVVS